MTGAVTIVALDEDETRSRSAALAALDRDLILELGVGYSHQAWTADQFAKPLPGKWEHSFAALVDGELAGFWIAWVRGSDLHTSRVGVARAGRARGIGRRLFAAALAAAQRSRLRRLTLTVASQNVTARAFYERVGFSRAAGEALAAYMHDTGRAGVARGDEIDEEVGGVVHRYVALTFDVERRCE